MVLCSLPSFHFRPREGVCDTPPRFSCNAETTIFSHHGLRNCFTIKDELANGKPTSAGHQGYFRDGEPWFEIRAKYIFHLRKEGCFLCKTAIATAMEVDHLAQTASAFAEMKLSLRHWYFGNRDKTLHTLKIPSPHLRWKHCRQNKGQEASAKVVYAPCIRLYFMPDTPTNRPAKTIANVTTYK